mgnify:CR=1 FL=1
MQQIKQPGYSIGVVARLTGLSTHTLRMWERRFGLSASRRTKSGHREYSRTDLDHLKLIKQLLDNGMRIGDIARLPHKTLTGMCLSESEDKEAESPLVLIETVVIGPQISQHLCQHGKRYPMLSLNCYRDDANEWLKSDSVVTDNTLLLLQVDVLNKPVMQRLIKLKHQGISVAVLYQFANQDVLQSLEKAGLVLARGSVDNDRVDQVVKQLLKQQRCVSALQVSAEQFSVTLPSTLPRQFTAQQLADVAEKKTSIACECPTHLAELVTALSAFETYSQQCEANNWQDAAVHACIYAYTRQARYLIENALVAVLDHDDTDTAH